MQRNMISNPHLEMRIQKLITKEINCWMQENKTKMSQLQYTV